MIRILPMSILAKPMDLVSCQVIRAAKNLGANNLEPLLCHLRRKLGKVESIYYFESNSFVTSYFVYLVELKHIRSEPRKSLSVADQKRFILAAKAFGYPCDGKTGVMVGRESGQKEDHDGLVPFDSLKLV